MSLVTNQPRTADIICQTPVRAALLSVDDFESLALQYPELRALLTEIVAERLGQSPYDSLSGKGVNGYRIVRCVGRGGMGIVYEAIRIEDGERVALKMMNHGLLYQPKADAPKDDIAIATWWMNLDPKPSDPYTLPNCPNQSEVDKK